MIGPQQQLAALEQAIGSAGQRAEQTGATKLATMLAGLESDAATAIATVSSFARGVYPPRLEKLGFRWRIPDGPDRERVNDVIMDELVNGVIRESSRRYLNSVIFKLREAGCNAVILGCTELPLLVDPEDCPLPVLDSTRLLARAALEEALKK